MSLTSALRWAVALAVMLAPNAASTYGASERTRCSSASDPTTPPVVVSVRDGGFDWTDAGVGAAGMLAGTLVAFGLAVALRPDRRSTTSPPQKEEA
jgi:hypothetical protein